MTNRVNLPPGLDQIVAARFARPAVDRLKDQVAEQARLRAPDGKIWITAQDERVRPAHADADGQLIPENLRYKLRKQAYVHGSGRGSGRRPGHYPGHTILVGGFDLGRVPRDEDLPADQVYNCRCESVSVPGAVARSIQAGLTEVAGTHVRAEVFSDFPRVAESEFGTSGDFGAHFMAGAIRAVAAGMR